MVNAQYLLIGQLSGTSQIEAQFSLYDVTKQSIVIEGGRACGGG